MARKHDEIDPGPDPVPVPCPTYEEAVAKVAAGTKTLVDAGMGSAAAAEVALKLYFRCCCGGE